MENTDDDWKSTTAARIGRAVKDRRDNLGLSAVRLAEQCAKLGHPIHRVTISKIEKGRGSFEIADLLILAAALEVPPILLLYPDLPDGEVEVRPGRRERSSKAMSWFADGKGQFKRDIEDVRTYVELKAKVGAANLLAKTNYSTDDIEELDEMRDELEGLRGWLRDRGYTVDD